MLNKQMVICCGVQKSGTTTFFEYLRKHPQIAPSKYKELHFFDNEDINWANPNYDIYRNSFEENRVSKYAFEATPIYYYWPDSIERIKKFAPDARIILIFRDPFERAWSQYCMNYYRGDENLDFRAAISVGRDRLKGLDIKHHDYRIYSYVERGYYADKLKIIQKYFAHNQILIASFEELKNNPQKLIDRVCDFLEIEKFKIQNKIALNARATIIYPSMPEYSDFEIVYNELNEQMHEFQKMTKLDISSWMTYSGNYGYTQQNLHKNR